MLFPDLRINEEERKKTSHLEKQLLGKLRQFFEERYKADPRIKISGSTNKGTALPERFFGMDIDASVEAYPKLLKQIAYQSEIFEGCQLFNISFLENFREYLGGVYFAGHRLSGKIEGRDFDFSITDPQKDRWKWDFNDSKYLQFTSRQREEIRKMKFFLKTFNLSGSEVNGVVGPAVELLIYHYRTFEETMKRICKFSPVQENFSNIFVTRPFPKEFYDLFPPMQDHVHRGLVKSFRYTVPNTYNRLLECFNRPTLSLSHFIEEHHPRFRVHYKLTTKHNKLVAYFLGSILQGYDSFHIDILPGKEGLAIYANASSSQAKVLEKICEQVEAFKSEKELVFPTLPKGIQRDIEAKCRGKDPSRYVFFIGEPRFPLNKNKVYIPFDFLLRSDCYNLIKVMEEGQHGA